MKIYKDKALIVATRRPELIIDRIPKSKLVKTHDNGISEVAVNWGIEEVVALADLRIKNPPSPIRKEYNWPGLHTPFDHQRTTAEFLSAHRRAYCLSEAGTGKTSAVIWAADYLMNKGIIRRALVVCPLSIMQAAWQGDLFKTAMHRTVGIAHGTAEKRKKMLAENTEFVVINYDGVDIVEKEILSGGFDLIIVDEANYVKTTSTRRWKALNRIIKQDTWVWLMTGTPAAQSPADAYGLAKLVNPASVPKFAGTFKDMVMQKVSQFTWVPRPNAQETVFKVLQPAIRYTKAECLDLPDVLYATREIPLTPQQEKYYKQIKLESFAQAAGEEITAVTAAVRLTKLLQVSSGSVYSDTGEVVEFDVSNRMTALKDIIQEASHKVLVFCPFRHGIETILKSLRDDGITCDEIHGDVSASRRAAVFKKFQETDEPRVLVIQPQAASHGVTLHAANVVVFWSPVMSVETYIQCCARVDRAGQRNPMTVFHLQGSPVEKKIYNMLENKIDIHQKLVDLYMDEQD